jgi:hypothetical protein
VPPTLSIDGVDSVDPNAVFSLDTNFSDALSHPASGYTVAWGDGSNNTYLPNGDGSFDVPTHVYSQAGPVEIDGSAWNEDGTATASTTLTVNDLQASGTANIDGSTEQGSTYTITATFDDPAGTPATGWQVA